MKNFLIICSIFIFAYFVRFYDYSNRIIFWTEQARSLITSLNYLDKPTLLGQEYFRQDSNSHIIYSGAYFNYLLLPIVLISSYSPVKITIFFTFLNIITGLGVYLVAKKYFGNKAAIISSILFLFNYFMIYHSLFIWNYNLLPFVGLVLTYLLMRNINEEKVSNIFYIGLFSGFGVSLQILFLLYSAIILIFVVFKSKNKIRNLLIFILGIILGNLPMLVFDVRHNFYQTNTIFQFLLDTLNGKSDAGFAYYYLLPLAPTVSIFIGAWLSKLNNIIILVVMLPYVYLNSNLALSLRNKNLKISEIDNVAKTILSDNYKGDFNVASDIDFDKRAYALRYYLKYVYQKKVMDIDQYQNPKVLYVIAKSDFNFRKSDTWEVKAGMYTKETELNKINNSYSIYKLQK